MWGWEDDMRSMCRCEDEKMRMREDMRWEDDMRRCEDGKMWRWEDDICVDVKMGKCEDEKMNICRCEDWKMWRWEDDIQTPTIRRTLRSDALGKNPEKLGRERDVNCGLHVPDHIHRCPLMHDWQHLGFPVFYSTVYKPELFSWNTSRCRRDNPLKLKYFSF